MHKLSITLLLALSVAACQRGSDYKPTSPAPGNAQPADAQPDMPLEQPAPERTWFPFVRGEPAILKSRDPSARWFDPAIQARPIKSGYSRKLKVLLLEQSLPYTVRSIKRIMECDEGLLYHSFIFDMEDVPAHPTSRVNDVPAIGPPFCTIDGELIEKKDEWLGLGYDVVVFGSVDPESFWYRGNYWHWIEQFVREGGGLILLAGPHMPSSHLTNGYFAKMFPFLAPSHKALEDLGSVKFFGLTPEGERHDLFNLGESEQQDRELWGGETANIYERGAINGIIWNCPVGPPKDDTTVLARAVPEGGLIADGPPLVAVREYGKGRVLAILTDDLWYWREYVGDAYLGHFWQNALRWASRDPGPG